MKLLILIMLFPLTSAFASMVVVKDACENKNWSQAKCVVTEKSPLNMTYDNEKEFNSELVDLGGWLGTLTEQMDNINNPDLGCFNDSGRLGRLTRYTKGIINRKKLSDCQKACVVKCITANYLTYEHSKKTGINQDSACQAANTGKGVCRSFSNLADHLMDSVGLKSQSRASDGHAFNKVFINNKWVYLEPQDAQCRFSLH
jgi:hypothetical protein